MSEGLSERLVGAIQGVHGAHPGHRAAHAKGACCEGVFTATPAAARLSRAEHLAGRPVPATVRFSNGSGAPTMPDYARDGRGLAVKLRLPSGASTDLVGITLPVFFVRTPEDFVAWMAASAPDPQTRQPDLARIGAFLEQHPETAAAFAASMGELNPRSYLTCAFNGLHTFFAVAVDGARRPFRYRWEPETGGGPMDREEARAAGRDYLREDLAARLAAGEAAFRLRFFLAQDGDPLDDPTTAWPEDREVVEAGRLVLTGQAADQDGGCEALVFDPTNVLDGIELSNDPILHARSGAYSVSIALRKGLRPPRPAAAAGAGATTAGAGATTAGAGAPTAPASPAAGATPATPSAVSLPAGVLAGLAPGGLTEVEIDGRPVALANVDGTVHAVAGLCTHRACALADGSLDGPIVTCPCHGSRFDVRTGEVVRGPAREPLDVFEVAAG
ncbi:MAG TPA: catalase [Candidatus Dormibacteraeota bacterium]|jgi:catalase|nr:catalase [Candidatus Dormibacteraeota bacterium]